ncbi:hypothetical protein J437_LFUL003193 [Ladona fulva]|uniref:Uncharacterized protein n=1 Tax=Ladona fulva TaxID=123851 RepID=A0A8K0JXF1_LADFU|nr:hypothetical protein J437_LFUL003193 [Ladona fulva]
MVCCQLVVEVPSVAPATGISRHKGVNGRRRTNKITFRRLSPRSGKHAKPRVEKKYRRKNEGRGLSIPADGLSFGRENPSGLPLRPPRN